MNYEDLFKELQTFRNNNSIKQGFNFNYENWYYFRGCFSHQQATRGDEKWFAKQIGGSTEGTGKQWWEPFERKVDIGDGFVGEKLIPGNNNYDLKVTFKRRNTITTIGFQQYRPADPIAYYVSLMGTSPTEYTLIVVPNDVAFRMKCDKIKNTGKLGSAHGTGMFDGLSTEEKIEVLKEAKINGKSIVIGFDVKKSIAKDDFELLMDTYRIKIEDVADFIK